MNNLRLIRIFELRGKIHPIEQYVIDILDGIEEVPDGEGIKYMKDDIYYFSYYRNTNNLWLSYALYEEFKTNFGCSYEEIRVIMKYLLEKHLNITINDIE